MVLNEFASKCRSLLLGAGRPASDRPGRASTLPGCLLLVLLATAAAAETRVIDGDTIEVDGRRYRLAGIDTPETNKKPNCANEREIGKAATQRLAELLTKGELTITVVGDGGFGRDLARVYAGGINVGETLLLEGLALRWTRGPKAKAARIAIWCPVAGGPAAN